jgi:hypothetical protein
MSDKKEKDGRKRGKVYTEPWRNNTFYKGPLWDW